MDLDRIISEVFGSYAPDAIAVLGGENKGRITGDSPNDSNEGYDGGNSGFHAPSQEKIAEGDVLGADGLWHSVDKGLFRINSRTFRDFMNRKARLLAANGITSFADMLDPRKNAMFARILFNEQGWNAWVAAPDGIKGRRDESPIWNNVDKRLAELMPAPTPEPVVLGSQSQRPEQQFAMGRLMSPLPRQNVASQTVQPSLPETGSLSENFTDSAKESASQFLAWAKARISQVFGNINPGIEVFNKAGMNTGTDFAVPEGTPVTLPRGEWLVEEAYGEDKMRGHIGNPSNRGYGNSVVVKNLETGERIRFSHLSKVTVKSGDRLLSGDIGFSGNTGNTTGPHLDVEYYDSNGRLADITKTNYYASSGLPVPLAQPTPPSIMERVKNTIVRPAYGSEPDLAQSMVKSSRIAEQSQPYMRDQLINPGDTLSALAKTNKTTVSSIMRLNPQIKDPNKIYPGERITVPVQGKPAPATPQQKAVSNTVPTPSKTIIKSPISKPTYTAPAIWGSSILRGQVPTPPRPFGTTPGASGKW